MRPRTPSYRLHRPTGQAVVTLSGRDVYLGIHGSPESRKAYDRAVSEWLANGRVAPPSGDQVLTIAELAEAYHRYVDGRYTSGEPGNIKAALKPVVEVYGEDPAAGFGPLALQAVRARYVQAGICRPRVNRRVQMVVRMFRWGVSRQMVPAATWEALRSLEGLRRGEAGTKEGKKVPPIADVWVDAVVSHVSRQVRAMVELQRLTGMRPGEVCIMRTCDLITTGKVWEYRPHQHKTEHLGKDRVVFIGPAAQEVLRPFLRPVLDEYLFSPREAEAERMAALRAARVSKVQPSQVDRARKGRIPKLGDRYTTGAYRKAVEYGIIKANLLRRRAEGGRAVMVPDWTPNQLRHTAATRIRRELGLDVAQVVLGHSTPQTTVIYAEVDQAKARAAMERLG